MAIERVSGSAGPAGAFNSSNSCAVKPVRAKQIAIACATSLSIWEISTGRQLWKGKATFEIFVVEQISADDSLVIGLLLEKGQDKVIEYTVINIRTENTVKYGGVEMPNYGAYLNCQLSLCGDFAALIVHSHGDPTCHLSTRGPRLLLGTNSKFLRHCQLRTTSFPTLTSGDSHSQWSELVRQQASTLRNPIQAGTYLVTFHTSSKEFSAIYRYYLSINLSEGGEDFSFRPAGHTFAPYQMQYSKLTYTGLALDSQSSGSTLYRLLLGFFWIAYPLIRRRLNEIWLRWKGNHYFCCR
ncbi:hypothetical protein B0H14DRAFT_3133307 [Mycena olivaceomarginata]|nr:hypothetical protein B0H14DRAFT_3133307 [Mycena olivaceomarginata]